MANQLEQDAQRIALGVEYDGSNYRGWQRQSHAKSIQSVVEQVLSEIANHPVEVTCAGRTDAGVHATAQVIHFDCHTERPLKAWLKGANSMLPDDISLTFAKPVTQEFHARFSATSRSYNYLIDNSTVKPAILASGLTWYAQALDESLINEAAQYFYGEQDFNAFRSSQCQSHSSFRNLTELTCERVGRYLKISISANAFLHHMVRNIVGVLLDIGTGRKSPDWAKTVLESKDRTQASVTAPGNGLYLTAVQYPEHFGLTSTTKAPLLF